MGRFLLLLLFSYFFYTSISAQNIEEMKSLSKKYSKYDSTYVYKYPHRILINPSFFLRTNFFSFKDISGLGNTIIYKPNTPMKLALVGAYKWLRLGIAVKLPAYLNDKGNTQTFALYLNTQTRILNWGVDFYWVRNKGYYLSNPDINIPGWRKGDEYPFNSNIQTTNIGFATHMVFSKKFSLKAAIHQTDRQLKSAGGMALQMGLSFSSMKSLDGSSLIPESQKEYYPLVSDLTKGSFVSLNIRPGYAYTYVHNGFFATVIAHFGVGIQVQTYKLKTKNDWGMQLSPAFKFNQILGYNKDNTFVKVSFTYESLSFHMKQTLFRNNFMLLSIGGGLRFK